MQKMIFIQGFLLKQTETILKSHNKAISTFMKLVLNFPQIYG